MMTRIAMGILVLAALGAAPASAQLVGENGTGVFVDEGGVVAGNDSLTVREAARAGQSIALTGRTYAVNVPARYVVQRGDTLWDICSSKLRNPWLWPQVWSLNPEVTNPHWIYPGQVIRLRTGGDVATGGTGGYWAERASGGTVFFRSEGFVAKSWESSPGEIAASWEDEMMLSYPDLLYVRFREEFPVEAGQQYTVYRPREMVYDTVEDEDGDPVELGRIVEILGTVTVVSFDPETRLARARLIESINPIERGDDVGPIERNFIVSPPRAADVDLDGQIVAQLRPRELISQNYIVFLNRGSDDGVRDGNRFQIIRANDHYLETIGEDVPVDLPFEWIGECHVLEARETASTCYVTASRMELRIGDRATLIRGQ